MVEVKWTHIINGLVIAVLLGLILGILTSWGDILGYLIATIYVGYSVNGDYMNGAIHGVIVGAVSAVIVLILSLIGLSALFADVAVVSGLVAIVTVLIFAIIIGGIIGAIGGIIGGLIKSKS